MSPSPVLLFALPILWLHSLAIAQPQGLLHTPECRAALAALSQEEDLLIALGPPGTAAAPSKLSQLQQAAAKACLGSASAANRSDVKRSPMPMPMPLPMPTPLTRPDPMRPGATANSPVMPQTRMPPGTAPVRQTPLVTLGSCDAQGCWASDGTRVQRLGPVLLGPRGYCTQTGPVLNCP